MIGDRHVFVIRAERVVGVSATSAIGRVVNAGEEIGEAGDLGRNVHRADRGVVQDLLGEIAGLAGILAVARQ